MEVQAPGGRDGSTAADNERELGQGRLLAQGVQGSGSSVEVSSPRGTWDVGGRRRGDNILSQRLRHPHCFSIPLGCVVSLTLTEKDYNLTNNFILK